MDSCRHVTRITPALNHSILNPQKWLCTECGTTESVWACLSCPNAACGRYNEEHAVKHFRETKHPLAIEVNEKYLFCYECDEYVLNDNAAGDIKILRSALGAIATQSFDDIDSRSPARLLRSKSYHGFTNRFDEENRLRKQDLTFTVLKFRRYYLLARVFGAWKHYADTCKQVKSSSSSQEPPVLVPMTSAASSPPSAKKKRAIKPGAVGLRNLGNTCYMNSVLQVLSHLMDFKDYFLGLKGLEPSTGGHINNSACSSTAEQLQVPNFMRQSTMECFQYLNSEHSKRGGLNGGGSSGSSSKRAQGIRASSRDKANISLCQELHALFRVLWSGKWALVSPHKMLVAVWTVIPFFKGYSQQDAQEFLCELLDKVEGELFRMFPKPAAVCPAPSTSQASSHRSMQSASPSHFADPDIVNKLFQGQLISEVKCLVCGNKSRTHEPFMDLSLEFPSRYQKSTTTQACSVEEMLSKFTETEKLDGKIYSCEQCNKKRRRSCAPLYTEAEKQFHIGKLPRVLRLHLKRFMWSGRNHRGKITGHVDFTDQLDMRPYCHEDAAEHSYTYQLSAVIMHHGRGFGSGHYTAYCFKADADTWLHCNDSRVQQCSLTDVMKSQAYILFYTKVDNPSSNDAPPKLASVFEEAADEDIVFNFRNSSIPRFMELKRRLSTDSDGPRVGKMRRPEIIKENTRMSGGASREITCWHQAEDSDA